MRRPKINRGYEPRPRKKVKKHKEIKYLSNLLMPFGKRASLPERIVKFAIYLGLRLIIPPRKWKYPDKNFEIIDRTYQRILSSDFIFIPSSIAFYFVMAFMPIVAIIKYVTIIPGIAWLFAGDRDLTDMLVRFVPGIGNILKSLTQIQAGNFADNLAANIALILSMMTSLLVASGGFTKIVYTQSYLYKHKTVGNFWRNKLRGVAIVLIFTLILTTLLLINARIEAAIMSSDLSARTQTAIKSSYLYVGMFLLVFGIYILLFKYSPRYQIAIRHILPGAAVATLPTAAFMSSFGYVTSLWSYDNYGVIGSIMYIGMSSLIISYFTFVGMITNVSYYQTFVNRPLVSRGKKQNHQY